MKPLTLLAFGPLLLAPRTVFAAMTVDQAVQSLRFEIEDGENKRQLTTGPAARDLSTTGGLVFSESVTPIAPNRVRLTLKLSNQDPLPRRLRLRWTATFAEPGLTYWPGRDEPIAPEDPIDPAGIGPDGDTLPLQAIYNDKAGLALALNPREVVSDFNQRASRTPAGTACTLEIPLILNGGEKDSFELNLITFTPNFGYLDAVQAYQSAYPEAFRPSANVDPRAAGSGATYTVWREDSPELARRYGADWEWCYAPFKRTGDLYARADNWNYQPARPFGPDWQTKTLADFHAERRQKLARGQRADVAMMLYTPSFSYAETQLALQKYPDAIIRKPDGTPALEFTTPWVTGHDNEILVYPWGTSYGAQAKADVEHLLGDGLNIQGFAFDVLNGGFRYRGEAVAKSARRAFDADGPYADLSLGIAAMMDLVHSFNYEGRNLAIVANPTGPCRAFLAARADSGMFEYPPYQRTGELRNLRLIMGQKTLSWWASWDMARMMDWRNMSPEEIRAACHGIEDYVLLTSFRYGGVPTPRMAAGHPKLVRWARTLKTVVAQGWQPVPAMRGLPDTLWPARYGNGIGSYLVLGNAAPSPFQGRVTVDNTYLGASNFVFAALGGVPIVQHCHDRVTELEVSIPAHTPLVLRAVAEVPAAPAESTFRAAWTDNGATGQLTLDNPVKLTKFTSLPENWLTAGAQETGLLHFKSPLQDAPSESIRDFPFFEGTRPATIILSAQPSDDELWAAQRLREYFRFWYAENPPPAPMPDLPLLKGQTTPAGNLIQIGGQAPITVTRSASGFTLRLNGNRKTVLHLLSLLDEKYPYAGKLSTTTKDDSAETELLKKTSLEGKALEEAG